MKPHIDPKVDFVFKMLLGNEQHKGLLIHFLNAVLGKDPGIHIQDVELLNPFNEREFESDKLSVVDVKARDDRGRWYQIEIQVVNHAGLIARMLFNWSSIYHRQLEKGKDYTSLKPVIAIWILNESLFDLPDVFRLPFVLWNKEHEILLSEDIRIELLQVPKWPGAHQIPDELDRWFCLFREAEDADTNDLPDLLQSDEMKEAVQVLQHVSESQREYFIYQQRLEALSLEATKEKEREELQRQKEEAERDLEKAKHEVEEAKHEIEEAKHEIEEAKHEIEETKHELGEVKREAEEAKRREVQERMEKERLLALLREAGIEPDSEKTH